MERQDPQSNLLPPLGGEFVKNHELKLLGLMDLTLICEVGGRALFSNCFIGEAVKRIQESRQLVVRRYGAGGQGERRVNRQGPPVVS